MTTTFNGFQSPNFTTIPNEYLDYTISTECDLTKVQMQIMNLFFRETFGWQDKNKILILSSNDIAVILGISKKKTVIDALNGLVNEKAFLESIEVCELSKEARKNIEESLDRALQPRQKIYRLNLVDRKNKRWDFAERTHINIKKRKNQSSDQMVTTMNAKKVTTMNAKKVTTLNVKTFDTVSAIQPLNKDLNKYIKKEEEEEEKVTPSELNSFLQSKGISAENAAKFENRTQEEGLTEFTYEQTLAAIEWSLEKFLEGKCDEPYIYAVGRLKRLLDGKAKEVAASNRKNKARKGKVIRTEILPVWFDEDPAEEKRKREAASKENSADIEAKKREIAELLLSIRS